jgi:hypothetical protein
MFSWCYGQSWLEDVYTYPTRTNHFLELPQVKLEKPIIAIL